MDRSRRTTIFSSLGTMIKFDQIYFRNLGFSCKLFRLKPIRNSPAAEQLFAALVRSDRDAALSLLQDHLDDEGIAYLFRFLETHGFAGMAQMRMFDLGLMAVFNERVDRCDKLNSLKLNKIVANEIGNSNRMEKTFGELLILLNQHLGDILWVKGSHLSRAIYEQQYFRQYGDFDIIVHPQNAVRLIEFLETEQFICPPFSFCCNQLGAGPTLRASDLFLAPNPEWIPVSNVTMKRSTWCEIDIKVGALDRGLQPVETDRFFAEAQLFSVGHHTYRAPNPIDHLMIICRNMERDQFRNWKSLMDVHLLAERVNAIPSGWDIFVDRCLIEAAATCGWIALSLAIDRFGSQIPLAVINRLQPNRRRALCFVLEPIFVWNSSSLISLILNAVASEDWKRKIQILIKSVIPRRDFLDRYFAGTSIAGHNFIVVLAYWLILILPAGLTRRTFGHLLWPNRQPLARRGVSVLS